jgi:hypothetical protein
MIFPRRRNERDRSLRIALSRISSAAVVAAAMLSAGCETVERIKEIVTADPAPAKKPPVIESSSVKKAPTTSEPPHSPATRAANAQTALNEGIELYDNGEFNAAIKRLNAPEISSADKSLQTRALKYMAFSYCVTSRQTLCRQQFEKALKIDPAFDLAPGEKGHPLWGAVFDRAKKRK